MRRLNKLILASLMSILALSTLITTTYAFVILQKEALVDDFDFNISSETGLLISLDGKTFSQDISFEEISKEIERVTTKPYSEVKYDGVTLQNENGRVLFDELGHPLFMRDPMPNENGDNLYVTDDNELLGSFLTLDFYFKVINQGNEMTKPLKLYLNDSKIASSGERIVTLDNSLTYLENKNPKVLTSGDTIMVDPANALRVGIKNYKSNEFKVYEPDSGLGSSAIEGADENGINDKSVNPMFTYYNSIHPSASERLVKAAINHEGFNTVSTDKLKDDFITEIEYVDGAYEIAHASISIWLEGWDADYFQGIPIESQKISISLGFRLDE